MRSVAVTDGDKVAGKVISESLSMVMALVIS